MPRRVVSLTSETIADVIRAAFERLREKMEIPAGFPPEVELEAQRIVDALSTKTPQENWPHHTAATLDIDFITIDPEGSMDLDQAVHIERSESGFTVHYAIADVAAFVVPGGAIDLEAQRRGTTLYAPDGRTPLHPPTLSEGAASLLPSEIRPAAVWTIGLDSEGKTTSIAVQRGLVRSRQRFSYVRAQELSDELAGSQSTAGEDELVGLPTIELLAQVGPLRLAAESARGGVSLNVPEQEVHVTADGGFELSFRRVLPIENWNAQISLLTGISAAELMLQVGTGLLRTLPPADPRDLKRLRRTAHALGLNWRKDVSYGDFLATLDSANPKHAAFQHEATTLFRGADYMAFSTDPRSGNPLGREDKPLLDPFESAKSVTGKHNAIGAHYAHVTAPLRRLGDRYTTEIALAASSGTEIPQWVIDVLPQLPQLLNSATRRANSYGRSTTDIVEAALLSNRIGELFEAVVVELDDRNFKKGEVMVSDPAVHAKVQSTEKLPLGHEVQVKLLQSDVDTQKIAFELVQTFDGAVEASSEPENDYREGAL